MRREFTNSSPDSLSLSIVPMRISTEMSDAIRRQHGTVGVEYKPTDSPYVNRASAKTPRKVSLTNIFFPHMDMNGNTTSGNFKKVPKGRSNGTDSKALAGSSTVYPQTTADAGQWSVSKRVSYKKPKDVFLTDFSSSFGMSDSRFPQPGPQQSQFYELCHAKVRYIDFLDDVVGYKTTTDSGARKGQEFSIGIPMERMHTFAIRRPVVRVNAQMRTASMSAMPLVPSMPMVPLVHACVRQPEPHRTIHTPVKSANRQQEFSVTNGELNFSSRKSALKQTASVNGHGKYLKTVAGDLAVRAKVHSGRNDKSKNQLPNDMAIYRRNTRSASMPFIVTKSTSEPSKKRGVHFSVCNEVFEYVPTAPVGQHH